MLSICGKPYDTLDEVIGIVENKSSLISKYSKEALLKLPNNFFNNLINLEIQTLV